jgi:intracellular multiplication protein IcmP
VSQQKSPHEDFIITFCVVFVVGGICWFIWYFFSVQITNAIRWVRVGEMYVVQTIFGENFKVLDPDTSRTLKVAEWRKAISGWDPATIGFDELRRMTLMGVLPLKLFFLGLMLCMSIVIIFKGPGTMYRRRMTLETLMMEQAKSFPAIHPFLKFDPRKLPARAPGQPVPSQLPVFSEALSPEEWIAYHEIKVAGGQVDRNKTYQALGEQLGRRWQGPEKMPIHMQALYAAFAYKHIRKRKDCESILNDLAKSWTPDGGLKISPALKGKIKAALKNPKVGPALKKFADQHAWETTAMLRCLQRAREEGGVVAPAEFVWLRGHDRNLWYALNNLGRKSYCAEASGALVHYTNELIAGQKIPTPRFEECIKGMETYLKSGAARAIPELDKKAGAAKYWK